MKGIKRRVTTVIVWKDGAWENCLWVNNAPTSITHIEARSLTSRGGELLIDIWKDPPRNHGKNEPWRWWWSADDQKAVEHKLRGLISDQALMSLSRQEEKPGFKCRFSVERGKTFCEASVLLVLKVLKALGVDEPETHYNTPRFTIHQKDQFLFGEEWVEFDEYLRRQTNVQFKITPMQVVHTLNEGGPTKTLDEIRETLSRQRNAPLSAIPESVVLQHLQDAKKIPSFVCTGKRNGATTWYIHEIK